MLMVPSAPARGEPTAAGSAKVSAHRFHAGGPESLGRLVAPGQPGEPVAGRAKPLGYRRADVARRPRQKQCMPPVPAEESFVPCVT